MSRKLFSFLAVALFLALSLPAAADLLGTNVTGSLTFGGGSINYLDSANGFVPAGYGNSSGSTTVTIANPLIEFGFQDGSNTETADFTGSTLSLKDISVNGHSASDVFTFTDTAFLGLTLSQISQNYPNGQTATLVGDVLTISTPGYISSGTFTSSYSLAPAVTSAPLPPTALAGLVCLGGVFAFRRKLAKA